MTIGYPRLRDSVVLAALVMVVLTAAHPALAQRFATESRTIVVGAMEREYRLHVPATLPASPAPLVFVFHGGNGQSLGTIRLTGFSEVADKERFIVVYPQGIERNWNDGRVTQFSQAHRDNIDDLAFFDSLLARISREHRIDANRVYATGISNGAIFSHYVAANRSEKIAAIAPVVGGIAAPFNERFKPTSPVSVLIIQGTEDLLIPFNGGKVAGAMVAGGGRQDRGSIIATAESIRLWRRANGCDAEPTTKPLTDRDPNDGCRTEEQRWSGGRGKSEVVLWRVQGGGHTWPSGPQYLPERVIGRVTRDFGSAEIWEFFRTHPKLGPRSD
jgi:polyhydroxybutyrate depolymerase